MVGTPSMNASARLAAMCSAWTRPVRGLPVMREAAPRQAVGGDRRRVTQLWVIADREDEAAELGMLLPDPGLALALTTLVLTSGATVRNGRYGLLADAVRTGLGPNILDPHRIV